MVLIIEFIVHIKCVLAKQYVFCCLFIPNNNLLLCCYVLQDVFPKDVFTYGGLKLLGPDYDPAYKKIYRENDLESGEAVAR